MLTRLHVNVDHCATLREARGTAFPDPVHAAALAELAGAHGITVHLREDRRHIQDRDVQILRRTVQGVLNLEMAATAEMVAIAIDLGPDLVTLVPERREERTTERGLDVSLPGVEQATRALSSRNIPVSLFIDPTPEAIRRAYELNVAEVELHTGLYVEADAQHKPVELERLALATEQAAGLSLKVAAGHGLDYLNTAHVARIIQIEELNIGHSIISRAVLVGMERAVKDMIDLIAA